MERLILVCYANEKLNKPVDLTVMNSQFAVPDDYRGSFQEKSLYNGLVTGYTGRGKESESLICS